MLVTLLPIVTFVRLQVLKAKPPMLVTLLGTMTPVRLPQQLNAVLRFCWLRGRMALDSSREFVNAFGKAGNLKRIAGPGATELETTRIAAAENELKEERAMVADLLPK
jgi:hypothetical protein